jgi:hypothetical protein
MTKRVPSFKLCKRISKYYSSSLDHTLHKIGQKKSQSTLFVIIGSLALVCLVLIFYLLSSSFKVYVPSDPESSAIESFATSCLKMTLQDSLNNISLSGGVLDSNNYVSYLNTKVPYYYIIGIDSIPSIESIQEDLAKLIDNKIDSCTAGFKEFKKKGYEVIAGNKSTVIEITETNVIATTKFNTLFKRGSFEFVLDSVSTSIPSRIDSIYTFATEIVQQHINNPNKLRISDIIKIQGNYGLNLSIDTIENDVIMYTIKDDEIAFRFACQFMSNPERQIDGEI